MEEFFQEIINIIPEWSPNLDLCQDSIANAEQIDKLRISLTKEISRLKFYLMEKTPQDRVLILEWVTNDLLIGYYETRLYIRRSHRSTSDKIRPIMLLLGETAMFVIMLGNTLQIKYREEFINDWKKRTSYFPFDFLFNSNTSIHTRKTIERSQSVSLSKELDTTISNIYFSNVYTEEEVETLFARLIDNNYFHSESDLAIWKCICGCFETSEPIKPINWIKTQEELAYLVSELFGDSDPTRFWAITKKAFTIKGKVPNTDTMKNTISKIKNDWKDKPAKFNKLKNILIL